MELKKLTVGMVTYDDFDGVYFTIQAMRLYHPEVIDKIEFIIIDNNPDGPHAKAINSLVGWNRNTIRYVPFSEYKSTSIRSKIFELANTEYVLCVDCHVLLVPGALAKLIDFFETKKDNGNLLQGPMLYDDLKGFATHFDLVWRAQMWGIWAQDERGNDINGEPFPIPAQGLGAFACRKDSWLGFNPRFRGFGGEEGYIHEKYRQAGKQAMCLPFFRWVHRFGRPNGIKYPLTLEHKLRNYFIGFLELGKDITPIYEHFKEFVPVEKIDSILETAKTTPQTTH